jgi:hypothetical protein
VQAVEGRVVCEIVGKAEAVSEGMTVIVVVSVNGITIDVSVAVGVGKLSGSVGGIWVGVAAAGKFSARARKIPPITKMTEKMPTITPMPNWRQACMLSSPRS